MVTFPAKVGCLKCLWLPTEYIYRHPSSSTFLIRSLTFMGLLYSPTRKAFLICSSSLSHQKICHPQKICHIERAQRVEGPAFAFRSFRPKTLRAPPISRSLRNGWET